MKHSPPMRDAAVIAGLMAAGGCWSLVPECVPRTGYQRDRGTLIRLGAGLARVGQNARIQHRRGRHGR